MGIRCFIICLLLAAAPLAADELRLDDFRGVQRAAWGDDDFRRYSLGFFAEPNTRIGFEPLAIMYTAGFEFGARVNPWFGCYGTIGIHFGYYDDEALEDDFGGALTHAGMSITSGVRFSGPHDYRTNGFMDIGAVFAGFHGEESETYSLGAEVFGGIEFGGPYLRGFFSTGVTFLVALNRADSGWMQTREQQGALGVHFTLIRGGIRFRF